MIDIHSHIIHEVDDGSQNIQNSLKLIEDAIVQGISDIICTPHYRSNMFETSLEEITKKFNELDKEVKQRKLPVKLHLGQEIYCRNFNSLVKYQNEHRVRCLANTDYMLIEFSANNETDIVEFVYNCQIENYKIVIAHIERYQYLTLDDIFELKSMGALIQINASSLIKPINKKVLKKVKQLLSNQLVDFVSSDIHASRTNYMKNAYILVAKKYGATVANNLFCDNAFKLIQET